MSGNALIPNDPGRPPSVTSHIFIFGITSAVFVSLAINEIFEFNAWGQITLLYSYHVPFLDLIDHPHFFRFFVTYPGLLAEDYWGYGWFSAYISIFIVGSGYLIYRICRHRGIFSVILALILIMPFHSLMNGRGVLSWFGWILVIFLITKPIRENYGRTSIALFFLAALCSSVSTGTFAVAFTAINMALIYRFSKNGFKRNVFILVILLLVFYGYFTVSFSKNIDFYDYGDGFLLNILSHGLGGILSKNIFLIIVVLTFVIFIPFIFDYLLKKIGFLNCVVLIVPLVGGIFGFTTLTLAIPAAVLLLVTRANPNSFHLAPVGQQQRQRVASFPTPS
jgi:hypothetical protein